jgi:hypothetical protein
MRDSEVTATPRKAATSAYLVGPNMIGAMVKATSEYEIDTYPSISHPDQAARIRFHWFPSMPTNFIRW